MVRIVALLWLVFLAAFVFGMWSVEHDLWPYRVMKELQDYVAGDREETTSFTEKLQNDLGLVPARHLETTGPKAWPDAEYQPLEDFPLGNRKQPPVLYLSEDAPRGYRLILGVFDLSEHLHGAVLLNPVGEIERIWQLTQEALDWDHPNDANVFPHGMDIAPDGSLLVAYDNGTSLTKYDWCGTVQWRLKGGFHHVITLGGDGTLWTWGNDGAATAYGDTMHRIRLSDGKLLRSIPISRIISENRLVDIFGIRQFDGPTHSPWIIEGGGPFHHNDVDPLHEHLADHYPQFETGDLLISMRSLNLVFVMDPDDYQVKWWRQGQTRRQHDPDWNNRGTFTIFNNNMHNGYSNILELNPRTMEADILLDGAGYGFYSWHRGKHQELPQGQLLITSSAQGRVFEVASNGEVTFDFHNLYDGGNKALALSEARFLPLDYFSGLPQCP